MSAAYQLNETLAAKCKAQEEALLKKDEEIQNLNDKLRDYDSHLKRFEAAFEERIHALDQERDHVAVERDQLIITLRARNDEVHRTKEETLKELEELRAEHKLAVETLKADYEAQIRILKDENAGIIAAHTHEMDKVLKVETSIDE